jgi:hypothetical protein
MNVRAQINRANRDIERSSMIASIEKFLRKAQKLIKADGPG